MSPNTGSDANVNESSLSLLTRAQAGDGPALEALIQRYRPRLRRWAHRRLPSWARDAVDTDDLVQDTLMRTVRNLDHLEPDEQGGLQQYLRAALANAVRDRIRRAGRLPQHAELDDDLPTGAPSPFELTIRNQRLDRYRRALEQLRPLEREAVIARLEFGFTHAELAATLGKPSADAARKECEKAVAHLLELMGRSEKL